MGIDTSVASAWRDAFDRSTHGLIVIDYPHHEIHGGSSFTAGGTVDLGSGGTINIHVKTPNSTKYPHVTFSITNELEAAVNLYEGFAPSGTADGGTPGVAVTASIATATAVRQTRPWSTAVLRLVRLARPRRVH